MAALCHTPAVSSDGLLDNPAASVCIGERLFNIVLRVSSAYAHVDKIQRSVG
jgi:hypothetical protein